MVPGVNSLEHRRPGSIPSFPPTPPVPPEFGSSLGVSNARSSSGSSVEEPPSGPAASGVTAPRRWASLGPSLGASSSTAEPNRESGAGPQMVASTPVTLQDLKGGCLYLRVLKVENFDVSQGNASAHGLCGPCRCGATIDPRNLNVSFTSSCFEGAVSSRGPTVVHPETKVAAFDNELLVRTLSYCGADALVIRLQAKDVTLGEASLPMRYTLPSSAAQTPLTQSLDASAAGEREAAAPLDAADWLQPRRVMLRSPPDGVSPDTTRGIQAQPLYLEIQMLHLVDNSLPQLKGTTPLLVAVQQRQELLVQSYLTIGILETMSTEEQDMCLTVAIENCFLGVLVQLLSRVKPSHRHLLAAILVGELSIVEALLDAAGPSLLHPLGLRSSSPSSSSAAGRGGRLGSHPGGLARRPVDSRLTSLTVPESCESQHTPLALACMLGRVALVEALCYWAKRDKVQVDPSAPVVANQGAAGVPQLWDHQDAASSKFGDPPMIMAVRSKSHMTVKRHLIGILTKYGFSVDVRSPFDSWTPLLAAVDLGSLELVTALVQLGARISSDRHLGFTPLHLACQTGQWHLLPILVDSMRIQYSRVAAWGPSPQYVSLNVVDVYGRTALDIALLRYFEISGDQAGTGSQKAVDSLREYLREPEETGVLCGWEVFRAFLDILPSSQKGIGAQLLGMADWTEQHATATDEGLASLASSFHTLEKRPQRGILGGASKSAEAVRVLVGAGAQTRWLLQDLLQPRSDSGRYAQGGLLSDGVVGPKEVGVQYSPVDPEDYDEAAALELSRPL